MFFCAILLALTSGENPAKEIDVSHFKKSSHPGHMMSEAHADRKDAVDTTPRFGLKNHLVKISPDLYLVGRTYLSRAEVIQRGIISNEPSSPRSGGIGEGNKWVSSFAGYRN